METFDINEMKRIKGRLIEIETQTKAEFEKCGMYLETIGDQINCDTNFKTPISNYRTAFLPRLLKGYSSGIREIIDYLEMLIENASSNNEDLEAKLKEVDSKLAGMEGNR